MKHIFIINPYAGVFDYSERIRKMLKKKENFEYLVFDTEYKGHETALAERMCGLFADEYIRFYACGGSGTFSNILQGIQDFEKTEMAYFPCGMTSDFLKCFGNGQVHFHNINKLIDGEPMYFDIMDFGKERAVNSFSVGLDAAVARDVEKYRTFSFIKPSFPYAISLFKNMVFGSTRFYEVEIDGQRYDGKYRFIYFGNGVCYGGAYYPLEEADPGDGKMQVVLVENLSFFKLLKERKHYIEGNRKEMERFAKILPASQFTIKSTDRYDLLCSLDGEFVAKKEISGRLCPGRLRMIVPKGVTVNHAGQVKEVLGNGAKG